MWHKMEVYVEVRRAFTMAWREYAVDGKVDGKTCELVWQTRKNEIADEVARHATAPNPLSPRMIRKNMVQMSMQPWKVPHTTQDDGVMEMDRRLMINYCKEWLRRTFPKKPAEQ